MAKLRYIFFAAAFVVLLLNFYSNFWHIAEENDFRKFDQIDESMVYGRLARSHADGIFSYGGFPGINHSEYDAAQKNDWPVDAPAQKALYYNKNAADATYFYAYRSQPGAQVIVYSLIDAVLPFHPEDNLEVMLFFNAILVAAVFMLLLVWVYQNYGGVAVATTFLLLLFSPWISKFGHSLWLAFWTYYLPMFGLLIAFHRKMNENRILALLFALFFIKCLFSGYEFITCTFLSIFIPIVYYFYLRKKTIKQFVFYSLKAGVVAVASIACIALLIVIQNSTILGDLASGFEYLITAYQRRSEFGHNWVVAGLKLPFGFYLVSLYLGGDMFPFNFWAHKMVIPFMAMIVLVAASMCVVYFKTRANKVERKYKALILATSLSFFASVSWFIVFKQHAFYHRHYDFICWYMPFFIFGFITIGATLAALVSQKKKAQMQPTKERTK